MKNKPLNAALLWKQFEDVLVPKLRLSTTDRAVYSQLLRHSRLEGRKRLRFSIAWLARGARLSPHPIRRSIRRLAAQGAVRLVQRTKAGHVVEVRLPMEVPGVLREIRSEKAIRLPRSGNLEGLDFMQHNVLREALHARDRGFCFYCLRRLTAAVRCLDHVVPQANCGGSSYRNLVSCCLECNSQKADQPAGDFLRKLYRERRLTGPEFTRRLRALEALAAGKLRPQLDRQEKNRRQKVWRREGGRGGR